MKKALWIVLGIVVLIVALASIGGGDDPEAETVAAGVIVVGSGLVAYLVNKLGSRWAWINYVLSLGRAKSPTVYIPANQEEATATATPPGEQTRIITTNAAGLVTEATV